MVATAITLLFLASASPALAEPRRPIPIHAAQTSRNAAVQNSYPERRHGAVKRRLRIVC